MLAADAWLDSFPDSDSYGGSTNIKGLELIFKYGLTTQSYIAIDYYNLDKINGNKANESLLQIDYNIKF